MTIIAPPVQPRTTRNYRPDRQAVDDLTFEQDPLQRLSPRDRALFQKFGAGPTGLPPHQLVHRAFEAHVAAQPNATAIEHNGQQISYGALNTAANRLARTLASRGVGPGDTVALFLRRSIHLVVAQLASMKLGATFAPQDVRVAPESQLRYVLQATRAKTVLTVAEHADLVPSSEALLLELDDVIDQGPAPRSTDHFVTDISYRPLVEPAKDRTADDVCFVLFTSGTTGAPNGVKVTHRNLCNILLTAPGNLGMGPGVLVAQILNIAFDMAAWETLGALANGATLLIRGSDIQETVARADVVIATPSILGALDPSACQQVKVAAVAGEPCPVPLADAWASFCTFYNSCGPTETTIINTAQRYQPETGALTIGRPTPNNTVYVLDEQRRPSPIGDVGEMWAGGDCVTAGYLNNPDLTDERYAPDPFLGGDRMMFRTRDLGRWTSTGELEHYGRTDDQVKIRGFRVELDSVSAALETVDGCTAAVTLKHDNRTLVAWVQPATVCPEAAQAAVAERLPYYCVPSLVTPVDELPRTARGKVDKRLLAHSVSDITFEGGAAR